MELRICHLYPELLNLNGDGGNVKILAQRAKRRGIEVRLSTLSFGERFCADDYDIVFLGNGSSEETDTVTKELLAHDVDALRSYVESDGVLLSICGGYEMLGIDKTLTDGTTIPGLSLLPIHVIVDEKRKIGNAVIRSGKNFVVGFENHLGKMNIGSLAPLGTVVLGCGNGDINQTEGCRYKNVIGTYLHGPILAKSPELADEIIVAALSRRYGSASLEPLNDFYEQAAKEQLLQRFLPEKAGSL